MPLAYYPVLIKSHAKYVPEPLNNSNFCSLH